LSVNKKERLKKHKPFRFMSYEKIISDLKKKIYHPIYFLHGDEPYYIDLITDYISEHVLSESEKSFNQTVIYGKETSAEEVDNAARRYPMMANHQVIILKEAQHLKNIDKLVYYAEKPLKSTILVINFKHKKPDKRKKFFKTLGKNAVIFESKKLYDNQVPAWIEKYLTDKNYNITTKASVLLTEFLGTELSKIKNELDKLMLVLPEGSKIDDAAIEKNIGISKDYNNFELQNALRDKDTVKAFRIAKHFASNPKNNPMILTINSLYYYFSKILTFHYLKDKSKNNAAAELKIHPFFVKDYQAAARKYPIAKAVRIISHLREYDMKAKGLGNVSTTHADLLKELLFKILY